MVKILRVDRRASTRKPTTIPTKSNQNPPTIQRTATTKPQQNEQRKRKTTHSTHTHITTRVHERIGNTVDQLPRYAKITQLDVALGFTEDVRGFDVWGEGKER
jgi:hypothetical protein